MNFLAFCCSIVSAFIIGVTLAGASDAFDVHHRYGKEEDYRRGMRNFWAMLLALIGIGASFMGLKFY